MAESDEKTYKSNQLEIVSVLILVVSYNLYTKLMSHDC